MCLGSYVHNLLGETLPISCTLGHTSTVSRLTPPPRPCTRSGTSTSSKVSPSQTLDLGSHVHSCQGDPTSSTLYLGSNVHSFQGDPSFQTLHLGSHIYSLKVIPLPNLHLWSQVHNVQDPLQDYIHIVISPQSPGSASSLDTALWVTCPQSPNKPTSQNLYWGPCVQSPGRLHLLDPASGATCPQYPL